MTVNDKSDNISGKFLSQWVVLTAIDDEIGDKGGYGSLRRRKKESFLIDIDFFGKILCVFNHNSFIG